MEYPTIQKLPFFENDMSSILIFCKTFLKGGAEKQALTLAKLMTHRKINVIVLSWSGERIDIEYIDYIKRNGIRFIGLRGNPISKIISFFKILKKEEVAIIISYLTLANFVSGMSTLFKKNIMVIGGIRTEKFSAFKFFFERIVHNYLNDATVFNNYSAKNKFELRGFDSKKIYVIHNSIFIMPLKENHKDRPEIKIITVNRFVKQKDYLTALTSFRNLLDSNPNKKFKFIIVGYGPLESEIRGIIKNLKLEKDVEILINPSNIPEILSKCDIYLSTSVFEGMSNSIMEAMAVGLPIVATNVGDVKYLVRDGYNGFITPCKDSGFIANKISYLTNSDSRSEFGNNSYTLIKNEFSEEKLLDNYLKLFTKLSCMRIVAQSKI